MLTNKWLYGVFNSAIVFSRFHLVGLDFQIYAIEIFLPKKKVPSFSGLSGRPSALCGRLKFQRSISRLNFVNFANLTKVCTTESTILNRMALFQFKK